MLQYRPFFKPALILLSGVFLLIITAFMVSQSGVLGSSAVEIIDDEVKNAGSGQPQVSSSTNGNNITVEVAGAVTKPGVHTLPAGSRVQDALIAAGNVSSLADTAFIEKTINKAAKVVDGQKIYIPEKGEASAPVLGSNSSTNTLINVNTASQGELDSLPGVGPATSAKIIAGRPYGSVDELVSKKAVTSGVFEKIKDLISIY